MNTRRFLFITLLLALLLMIASVLIGSVRAGGDYITVQPTKTPPACPPCEWPPKSGPYQQYVPVVMAGDGNPYP